MSDETPNPPPGSSAGLPPTPDPEAAREYYREHYVRALDARNFMGNMRASIAWFPTIIVVSSMTFVANATGQYRPAMLIMWVLLLVILISNYLYQREQSQSLEIARECEQRWRAALSAEPVELLPYSRLKEIVASRIRKMPDPATTLLGLLLIGIAVGSAILINLPKPNQQVPSGTAGISHCLSNGSNGPAPSAHAPPDGQNIH